MIAAGVLLADAERMVKGLEADLRQRVASEPAVPDLLWDRYAAGKRGQRTGIPTETWRDQQLTQIAAGGVLACVFTRFCGQPDLREGQLVPAVSLRAVPFGGHICDAKQGGCGWALA